ncbi:hypothetical protein SYNPS1DRAFT_20968 [Syncephalis pseudoplumigaleata]|uniref:Uncharacterized protein n=1 Tax=Syncephalis pseudoplumigaleata TaxID=1712513 RepID=A0A4P9Z518_9FUNG|nr:hypothetical protein SYNPS1DRAFT_20968 [Syncephalis pseudoplumigaleata]|eukprot:RKP27528.1 hypothetical protein SYNPS1DRAFT_20968 [Syncephalis pseudoplumigaleata]
MIIDSDSEDWSPVGMTTVRRVEWPADAPTRCRILVVQPVTGPLSLSARARDLGEARVHFDASEEGPLPDRHARRMPIHGEDGIVTVFCDAILWEHADTLMAGRLLARFGPQQLILADFNDGNAVSTMITSHGAGQLRAPVSARVARGLPAALLSLSEMRGVPAYYLTHGDAAATGEITDLLGQLSKHINLPLLQTLFGQPSRQHHIARDNLYI